MPNIRSYKELRVYQAAIDAATHIRDYQALPGGRAILNGRSDEASFAISLFEHW